MPSPDLSMSYNYTSNDIFPLLRYINKGLANSMMKSKYNLLGPSKLSHYRMWRSVKERGTGLTSNLIPC